MIDYLHMSPQKQNLADFILPVELFVNINIMIWLDLLIEIFLFDLVWDKEDLGKEPEWALSIAKKIL